MEEKSDDSVATVAIVVHGVGDHSSYHIMNEGRSGLRDLREPGIRVEAVTLAAILDDAEPGRPHRALRVTSSGNVHLFVPLVWSRLRPRSANEVGPAPTQFLAILAKLFRACFILVLASFNAIRCIPATTGCARKAVMTVVALIYAVLAPGLAAAIYFLLIQIGIQRASMEHDDHRWWMGPAFVAGMVVLSWPIIRVLMVLDFVGDVVGYVGSNRLREKAKSRLLGLLRRCASQYPRARIVVIGHSLGSVLATQAAQGPGAKNLAGRLHVVTMGSPLLSMSGFFPSRVHRPAELVRDYEAQNVVGSWANLWRDADSIGQRLGPLAWGRFGERSLGDGEHSNYWSDVRCWRAVIEHLSALSEGSWEEVVKDWNSGQLSESERHELFQQSAFFSRITVLFPVVLSGVAWWLWKGDHGGWSLQRNYPFALSLLSLVPFLTALSMVTVTFVKSFTSPSPTDQLGRFRHCRRRTGILFKFGLLLALIAVVWRGVSWLSGALQLG